MLRLSPQIPTNPEALPAWIVSGVVSSVPEAQIISESQSEPTKIVEVKLLPEAEDPPIPEVKVVPVPVKVEPIVVSEPVPGMKAVPVHDTIIDSQEETKEAPSQPAIEVVTPKKTPSKRTIRYSETGKEDSSEKPLISSPPVVVR